MSGECVKEDEKMFRDLAEKCPVEFSSRTAN